MYDDTVSFSDGQRFRSHRFGFVRNDAVVEDLEYIQISIDVTDSKTVVTEGQLTRAFSSFYIRFFDRTGAFLYNIIISFCHILPYYAKRKY